MSPAVTITSDAGEPFGGLAPTVTLHDVELCRVGQWNASTGAAPITAEVLHAIVAAAADPEVDHAPVHPGHFDPRFPALSDGEPALGWVERLRVQGDRLVGDLVDVPAKLAGIIPKAYRRRSVELARDVSTPSGRRHAYALAGLGLLGAEMPAVKGLRDVVERYSAAPVTTGSGALEAHVIDESAPAAPPASTPAPASAPSSPGAPPVVLSTIPVHTRHLEERPVPRHTDERLRQLLNLAADADVSALQRELAAMPEAAAAQAVADAAATAQQTPAATGVVPATPGLPAAGAPGAPVPAQQQTAPQQVGQPATTNVTAEQTGARELVTASQAHPQQQAPGVFLSAGQWQTVQTVLAEQTETRRQGLIAAALSSGRITPAEAPQWQQALAEPGHEQHTERLLSLLPAGRVPVTELGSTGHANLSAHREATEAAYAAFEATLGLNLPTTTSTAPSAQTGA